jgi:hypothetical protein
VKRLETSTTSTGPAPAQENWSPDVQQQQILPPFGAGTERER